MPNNTSGWIFDPEAVDKVCSDLPQGIFGDAAAHLKDSGKDKTILLYKSYDKIGMKYPVLNQGDVGSCTAVSTGGAVDCLKAVEIAGGERSEFKAETVSESIYYGARKLHGWRINGDGSAVALAVKYIAEYGTLARLKYDLVDLTKYSVQRCRDWGNNKGFPIKLEDISKQYQVKQYSRVMSWEQCRDSIANNCPVLIGSNFGFSNTTDTKGFAKNNTNWGHCMKILGIRHDRPGGLFVNTWGPSWNSMKNREFGEPMGSFWVDADTIDRMMRSGDGWSISAHNGYPKKITMEVAW